MYKYNEYHCMACEKDFPIGNEHVFQDNCYIDVIHEKCPLCGSIDTLADVYDDPYAAGKLIVSHPDVIIGSIIAPQRKQI